MGTFDLYKMWLDCQTFTFRADFHFKKLIMWFCMKFSKLFALWWSLWSEGWFFTPPRGRSSFPPTPREEWIEDGQFEANPGRGEYTTHFTAVYWSKNLRGDESVYIQWSVAFLVYMQHNIYIIHTKLYTESHIPLSVFSSAGREMYRH